MTPDEKMQAGLADGTLQIRAVSGRVSSHALARLLLEQPRTTIVLNGRHDMIDVSTASSGPGFEIRGALELRLRFFADTLTVDDLAARLPFEVSGDAPEAFGTGVQVTSAAWRPSPRPAASAAVALCGHPPAKPGDMLCPVCRADAQAKALPLGVYLRDLDDREYARRVRQGRPVEVLRDRQAIAAAMEDTTEEGGRP